MFILNFFKSPDGYYKDDLIYKAHMEEARKWNSLMTVIIKKADSLDHEDKDTVVKGNPINSISIADEIIKLKTLKDEGILSDKEFDEQKNKLLTS